MKKLFVLLLLSVSAIFSFACSTFLLNKNGQLVFGRNYDWISGTGIIVVNPAGLPKTSFIPGNEKTINWTSRYGSVSFNQFGKEMPHGGMNQKGLVVELMWLQGTIYPAPDNRAAVNELQWVQYQLDNCSTVEEVLATDQIIRISRDNAVPLHFLIADASGDAATIEFLNGKTVVHRGSKLKMPVLTNSTYASSIAQLEPSTRAANNNSLDRFTRACNLLNSYHQNNSNTPPVDYAFSILQEVSQNSYTKWSIVYDISNQAIHFVTADNKVKRSIRFAELDFSCKGQTIAQDINAPLKGNISDKFTTLTATRNLEIIRQSAEEAKDQLQIREEDIIALGKYFESIHCN